MAKLYANRIMQGKMLLSDVPARWKADVEKILKEENYIY